MIKVPIPENYSSLDNLRIWLEQNLPHVDHWGDVRRWEIVAPGLGDGWQIWFNANSDATLFILKWPR